METMTARQLIEGDDGFGISWEGADDAPGLFVEFLKMIKIGPETKLQIEWDDVYPRQRKIPSTGWALFINADDWNVAVYHDGKPIAGQYSSFRGSLHQDGAFIIDQSLYEMADYVSEKPPGKHWYAHNLPGVSGRSMNVDVWEDGEGDLCSQIAEEWLLGTEMFGPEETHDDDEDK